MRERAVLFVAVCWVLLSLVSCIYVSNLRPVASFTALPAVGTTPLDVTLDATDSRDPDGTITAYLWDFGDDQTLSRSIFPFTHLFTVQSSSETFTIVLTVRDDQGGTDTAVQYVTVNP
jgi:PKD repeat protein